MKRPNQVRVLSKRIQVLDVEGEHEEVAGRSMAGKIELSSDLTPDDERETFLHEILHHLFIMSPFSSRQNERIISFLSPLLYDTLRQNPDLVEWLLYEEAV